MWSNRALERALTSGLRLGFSAQEAQRPPALRREPKTGEAEQQHRPGREFWNGRGGRVGRVDYWRRRVDYRRRRVEYGSGEYRGIGKVARNLAGSAEKNSGHITKTL
jgi:hypothetical protein